MNCTFDPIGHLYTIDGRPVPSVTQVLSSTGILPSFSMVDKVLLERKRQIGVALHAALHYLQQGDLDESTVDERVKPRLDAYRLFVAETGFKPIDCELRIWPTVAGMQYAGTLDVTGTIKGRTMVSGFQVAEGTAIPWFCNSVIGVREWHSTAANSSFPVEKDDSSIKKGRPLLPN